MLAQWKFRGYILQITDYSRVIIFVMLLLFAIFSIAICSL